LCFAISKGEFDNPTKPTNEEKRTWGSARRYSATTHPRRERVEPVLTDRASPAQFGVQVVQRSGERFGIEGFRGEMLISSRQVRDFDSSFWNDWKWVALQRTAECRTRSPPIPNGRIDASRSLNE
jgi:hypothetical protein